VKSIWLLDKALDRPDDDGKKENNDGNLVDPVHHPQVEVCRFVGIRLFENIQKIVAHLTQLEEFFDFAVF
jgi:hypothetical protein